MMSLNIIYYSCIRKNLKTGTNDR
uniref:Uncharacterized protein n=1 Tax=Lepeophtheirus salmonis TaxID=72036 RepID=A0A0K2U549_LEPSM